MGDIACYVVGSDIEVFECTSMATLPVGKREVKRLEAESSRNGKVCSCEDSLSLLWG